MFTTKENQVRKMTRLYEVSTGNYFSKYIQENETRNLQLFETEFYKHWKYPTDKTRTRLVNRSHTVNITETAKTVNSVWCNPIYAR